MYFFYLRSENCYSIFKAIVVDLKNVLNLSTKSNIFSRVQNVWQKNSFLLFPAYLCYTNNKVAYFF